MTVALERVYERAAAEVVPVLREMISHDTTIGDHDDPPRDDSAHQAFVAGYLRDLGAEVEVFEPEPAEYSGHRMHRPNQVFDGRPIVWARLPGTGGGRSLLFNGHFDTVPADPIDAWTTSPWDAAVRDGRIYGRGSCDMKGGIAASLAMAHALVAEGVSLSGDLLFNVVPFEEVNGMGTVATMLRGHRADAAVCCEPTELNTLIACRGILLAELSVTGRSAHAELVQPHHSEGGGVSAIDKLIDLLVEFRRLDADWRQRADKQHDLLGTPYVLTTLIEGGAFASNWPAAASATLNVCYMPADADETGYGARVREEIETFVARAAALDTWLEGNPPRIEWLCDFPPKELDREHPLVGMVSAVAREQGATGNRLVGLDSWADQVTLMQDGGIPAVCFGPGSLLSAHTVDEFVPLDDLETCTRVYADLAVRWCGDAT